MILHYVQNAEAVAYMLRIHEKIVEESGEERSAICAILDLRHTKFLR